jgi:hypothetical protein
MADRKPELRPVHGRTDISDLIPGDRVFVMISSASDRKLMTYVGHNPAAFDETTLCQFIGLPEGYKGRDVPCFNVWKTELYQLRYRRGSILFPEEHIRMEAVVPETEEYKIMKSLADMPTD